MARIEIVEILGRATLLSKEISSFVPNDTRSIQFRADLAGLLVVTMAASYESCVKETLVNFASRHHPQFERFTQNQFGKLNSRIALPDLHRYASTFDDSINVKFKNNLLTRKNQILSRVGRDFVKAYSQILDWRHDFAHAGVRNTTIEEALTYHILAKRVLYAFDDAFN